MCMESPGLLKCGLGSSVGIATGYGLDGPGIESRWRRDFPRLSRPALGPTQPPVQWVPVFSLGLREVGTWGWPLTPSSAMVKKEYSCTSTPRMSHKACTEPQCLYKGAFYLFYPIEIRIYLLLLFQPHTKTWVNQSICYFNYHTN